jgi:hypothetical protein
MIALDSVMAALIDRAETVALMIRADPNRITKADLADALANHTLTLVAELRERAERPADVRRGAA